jgi:hypothetical protein
MAYIGKQPIVGNFVKLDAITTSATTTFNLLNGGVAYYPQSANNCIVSLNGVIQSPTSAYTISGSTIVFSDALTSSDTIDFILVLGDVLSIGTPSDGTVTAAKLASGTAGLIAWQSVQTTGFTASAGRGYPCNTTSAAFTVTLPASPSVGDTIILLDYAGTFDTNALTINPNGNKIEGGTINLQLTGEREGATLTYIDSTQGWLASSGINEGTDALSPVTYSVDFLVVAGGGGGAFNYAGGGGAGGYRTSTQTVTAGTVITVTVGDGGGVSNSGAGNSGSNSSISGSGLTTITSAGGGGGGSQGSGTGLSGGSGGGAGGDGSGPSPVSGGSGNTPSTSPSQGNNGGSSFPQDQYGPAGGGGGASAAGGNASSKTAGNGGAGTSSSITGSSVTRAGGGGGGVVSQSDSVAGSGGSGGGGAGGGGGSPGSTAVSGTANTGGGGGGGGNHSGSAQPGAAGGKGVVILSLPIANYSNTTTGSPTVTESGSNKILVFNGSGSYTA